MAESSIALALPVAGPQGGLEVGDARESFAEMTGRSPRQPEFEAAFLASKLHILHTHPTLALAERDAAHAELSARLALPKGAKPQGPVPGGVGYGIFYNSPFKTAFGLGTAIYFPVICPNPPGGNVNTFLYLTATNRSAMGVEAFVAYNGQNSTFFKVFDWARYPNAPWQTNIPFGNLGNYLQTTSAHGHPYQTLSIYNATVASQSGYWYNQVFLWNHAANRWDLVYQYGYTATVAQQQTGWVGSWGPIVETFQNAYQGTGAMGAINTQLISMDQNGNWGSWHLPGPADSYVRTDNKGFKLLFLDANYTWAVNS